MHGICSALRSCILKTNYATCSMWLECPCTCRLLNTVRSDQHDAEGALDEPCTAAAPRARSGTALVTRCGVLR